MVEEYITVSKVTDYIGELIGSDSNLKHIFIKGELSNVKLYPSGHLYFTLKDDEISIVICKEYQNQHIGRRCVQNILKLAKEKGLNQVRAEIYSFNDKPAHGPFFIILFASFLTESSHVSPSPSAGLFPKAFESLEPPHTVSLGQYVSESGYMFLLMFITKFSSPLQ